MPYQGQYLNRQLGNYRLTKLLGEGGFAEVYLGEHLYLDRQVAIKVLTSKLTDEEIADFLKEARTLSKLPHPNIVRILDVGMEGRLPFIIMDYAPNGSLRTLHPKGTCLPLWIIVAYVKQIAEALQYVHNQGLVHRDIKPDNILLGRNNELLLSDFGIVTISYTVDSSKTQYLAGTWLYIAPEQINAKPHRASDQYALGIVVYEWLSGTPPFQGSLAELSQKHTTEQPPSLCATIPDLPSAIEQVVLKALAKDPNQRFATVQAFAKALEEACQMPTPPVPGTLLLTYRGHSNGVTTVAWSPDRSRIASGSIDKTVQMWDINKGQPILIYRGHSKQVLTVTWSPDSRYLASGSEDGTVQIWQANTGERNQMYRRHANGVTAVAWSPDGSRIASGSYGTVQVRDIGASQYILTYGGHSNWVRAVTWSPDGSYIASGDLDGKVHIWQTSNGKLILTYSGHSTEELAHGVTAVAWSPDGSRIASGSADKTIQVWNASTGELISIYSGHSNMVSAVAWSPDGSRIASGSSDGTVRVWQASNGQQLLVYGGHSDPVAAVAWSPDGSRIASGSYDRTVQVWQAG